MSDETFGRAARQEWDRMAEEHDSKQIAVALDMMRSAIGVIEDYQDGDATIKEAQAACDRMNDALGKLGYYI